MNYIHSCIVINIPSFSFRAQSAFGVLNAEDPFLKLKREILWDVVTNQCITLILLKKVPEM